jgi:hypothetical protein
MSHYPHIALLLTGITLAFSACATGPDPDVTIHESERGAVYVERIPDRSFHTAHPITLSTDTMARVLRGVVVTDSPRILGKLVGRMPEAVRAFKDEDVEYLAPLLVGGLTRAASYKSERRSNCNRSGRSFACQTSVPPVSVNQKNLRGEHRWKRREVRSTSMDSRCI